MYLEERKEIQQIKKHKKGKSRGIQKKRYYVERGIKRKRKETIIKKVKRYIDGRKDPYLKDRKEIKQKGT